MQPEQEARSLSPWTSLSRYVVVAAMGLALAGCGQGDPLSSGGRSAAYWAEVLQQPHPDVSLRRKAAAKLGPLVLKDDDAFPALLDALKDPDPTVRSLAARSLSIYSGPKADLALSALVEMQEHERNKKVIDALDKAIARLDAGL
jgi:HEAT repeat protein